MVSVAWRHSPGSVPAATVVGCFIATPFEAAKIRSVANPSYAQGPCGGYPCDNHSIHSMSGRNLFRVVRLLVHRMQGIPLGLDSSNV